MNQHLSRRRVCGKMLRKPDAESGKKRRCTKRKSLKTIWFSAVNHDNMELVVRFHPLASLLHLVQLHLRAVDSRIASVLRHQLVVRTRFLNHAVTN